MREVARKIIDVGILPVFFNKDVERSKEIIKVCYKGGAKIVEFTNRGRLAYTIFKELIEWAEKELPDLILGAGTIIDVGSASLFINSGASFIVSPIFDQDVAELCNKRGILYIPGCMTPNEIAIAEKHGAEIVKLFPAKVDGKAFIKALKGPFPYIHLMPSGGVDTTKEDVVGWIKAGASALNIGTSLIRKDLVEEGRFDEISSLVEKCISWVREARSI